MCKKCCKAAVCKIYDILDKFDDSVKKPLGVEITMNTCSNSDIDENENTDGEDES